MKTVEYKEGPVTRLQVLPLTLIDIKYEYIIYINPNVHGSFTEHMPHECGRIRPQDLRVKLPTPVRDGCQTLRSVGGIISGRERSIV